MAEIINKVAGSGIVSIDPEEFRTEGERVLFDLKPHLFNELILKEKDFRDFVKKHNWSQYGGKITGIVCTADAIVPTWAYMLIALALQPYAKRVFFGGLGEIENILYAEKISAFDPSKYRGARVVIKGCSGNEVPANAYVLLSAMLKPYVKSIMYGEPCSTVPLYKAPV